MKVKFLNFIICAGLLMALSVEVRAEQVGPIIPVGPSDAMIPKSKVVDVEQLDLPYKPKDPDEKLVPDGSDENLHPETGKKKETVDWTQIPYVPSKSPDLMPGEDPKL